MTNATAPSLLDPRYLEDPNELSGEKKRITGWIEAELLEHIRSAAHHMGVGVSPIYQEALAEWVEKRMPESIQGFDHVTRTVVQKRPGEWFPPLPEDVQIRRGKRSS